MSPRAVMRRVMAVSPVVAARADMAGGARFGQPCDLGIFAEKKPRARSRSVAMRAHDVIIAAEIGQRLFSGIADRDDAADADRVTAVDHLLGQRAGEGGRARQDRAVWRRRD